MIIRSLIEWFDESGLAPALRLPNPASAQARQYNNTSIVSLAEDLRLWPSELYEEEDNANLPPLRLLATDGSFKVKPRGLHDIITPEHILRNHGKGSGGMVFLPPGYNREHHTPAAIRIISDSPEPGMNAFYWELVTQLIGLYFIQYQPRHLVLTSDCTSAIVITNKALRSHLNTQPNVRGGLFASGIHQFSDPFDPRYFIHTQCHPERYFTRRVSPSIRDLGMLISDAVASKTNPLPNHSTHPEAHQPARGDSTRRTMAPPYHRRHGLPSDQRYHQLPASIPAEDHGTKARRPPRS
jgi:hypothetical protein